MNSFKFIHILFLLLLPFFQLCAQGGELDPDFNNGSVSLAGINFTGNLSGWNGAALQSDGKIIAFLSVNEGIQMVRFKTDGSLDEEFGTVENTAFGRSIKVLENDNFIIGTLSGKVIKYKSEGKVDTEFDNSEYKVMRIYGINTQADDKILVTGATDDGIVLARYLPDGSPDPDFVATDELEINLGPSINWGRSVVQLSDESILVAASGGDGTAVLIKTDVSGNLDTAFGTDGILSFTDISEVNFSNQFEVLEEGKILSVGGNFSDEGNIFFSKRNTDGSLDSSFGTNGVVFDTADGSDLFGDFSPNFQTNNFQIQSDGKIVVNGAHRSEATNNEWALAVRRYHADGSVDLDFGTEGTAVAFVNLTTMGYPWIFIDNDDNIIQVATAIKGVTYDLAVAKYLCCASVGTLDFGLKNNALMVFPNPISETLNLEFTLEEEKALSVFISDLNGKKIHQSITTRSFNAGDHSLNLDILQSLASGNYIVTILNKDIPVSIQFTKL